MAKHETTRPVMFLLLLLPYGIRTGFASITLPYRYGDIWMLNAEALLALVFVAGGLLALNRINAHRRAAVLP